MLYSGLEPQAQGTTMDIFSLNFFNHVLFWVTVYVLAYNAYMLIFNKGVPNIRTAPAVRAKIIEILKADMAARPQERPYLIIDMGSGNGLFTREIAKAIPDAQVLGLEFSRQSIFWSRLMQKRDGLKNLDYKRTDFFAYDLGAASAVVLYLSIYEMGRMGIKLNQNLRPGTLVTSNKFQLGDGWQPREIVQIDTMYLHQGKLNVYRKP